MNKMICSTLTIITLSTLMSCGGSNENDIQPVEQPQTRLTQETPTPSTTLNLPATPFDYATLNLPEHFTLDVLGQPLPTSVNGLDNTPSGNPVTNDGATLGRVLFLRQETQCQ